MIRFSEIATGEMWELFARDFLSELGFVIETPPDRGADHGKDMLAAEQLAGKLANYRFRWMVSCKHFATSERAISEEHEPNILERLESFEADGFLGFYSTLPTANLNARLHELRERGKLRDYRIFDGQLIENYLLRVGYSGLVMRYFRESYKRVRPLHAIADQYVPLPCAACGKDLLEALYAEEYNAILGFGNIASNSHEPLRIERVYWACKGKCDLIMEARCRSVDLVTGWEDLTDLAIPAFYLQFVFSVMNSIRGGHKVFGEQAYDDLKTFIFALGQKALRENTERERERVRDLRDLSILTP